MHTGQNHTAVGDEAQRIKVLLVDDEAPFRKNVARLLEKRGFETRQAEDGRAGLAVVASWAPAVVVLDVKMPGIDGLTVLKRIRDQHAPVEVILLTGQASASDGVAGIKAGAFDYLGKPIEIDHLSGKIRQAYEKIRLQAENRRVARFQAAVEKRLAESERLAALGTLATGVAHEINNPLALIKQSAHLMRRVVPRLSRGGVEDLAKVESSLKNIEAGTERIRRITHQLLGYVGKNNVVSEQVDMADMMADIISLVQGAVAEKEICINTQIGPGAGRIRTEPYKLRQILVNLAVNALQATGTGGRLDIETAIDTGDFIVRLADSGAGILPEHLDKIFDPFFTTKGPGEGTGLGLFITRSIVKALGGTLSVESRPGEGSVFSVRLPIDGEIDAPDESRPERTAGV